MSKSSTVQRDHNYTHKLKWNSIGISPSFGRGATPQTHVKLVEANASMFGTTFYGNVSHRPIIRVAQCDWHNVKTCFYTGALQHQQSESCFYPFSLKHTLRDLDAMTHSNIPGHSKYIIWYIMNISFWIASLLTRIGECHGSFKTPPRIWVYA